MQASLKVSHCVANSTDIEGREKRSERRGGERREGWENEKGEEVERRSEEKWVVKRCEEMGE